MNNPDTRMHKVLLKTRAVLLHILKIAAVIVALHYAAKFFASPGMPPVLGALLWDEVYAESIPGLMIVRQLPGFAIEILIPLAFLAVAGVLVYAIMKRQKRAAFPERWTIVVLILYCIPSFVLAILARRLPPFVPTGLQLVAVAILGNTILYTFIREQVEFLTKELSADYIVAARIRGDTLGVHILHRYVNSMMFSMSRVFPLIVAALVVGEKMLNVGQGLCNSVLERFGYYLSDKAHNLSGLGYLAWFVVLCLFLQWEMKVIRFAIFGKRLRLQRSMPGRIQGSFDSSCLEGGQADDDAANDAFNTSEGETSSVHRTHEAHPTSPEPMATLTEAGFARSRKRLLKPGHSSARIVLVLDAHRWRAAVVAVLATILIACTILGAAQGSPGSYLATIAAADIRLDSLRASKKAEVYDAVVSDSVLTFSARDVGRPEGSAAESPQPSGVAVPSNQGSQGKQPPSQDSFGDDGLIPGSTEVLSEDTDMVARGSSSEALTLGGRPLAQIRLEGASSWPRAELISTLSDGRQLSWLYPFGTDAGGHSVVGLVLLAIAAYPSRLLLLAVIAGLLGVMLGIVGGQLYRMHSVFFGILDTVIEMLDSVPKLVFLLLFLPALPQNSSEAVYFSALMGLMGLLFVPTVYKTVFERIQLFLEKDFIDAEMQLGKTYLEIVIKHVLWRNSLAHILGLLSRIGAVAVLMETSLGALGFIQGRYHSLATLIPLDLRKLPNIAELLVPIGSIALLLVLFNLAAELFFAGTINEC
jgi:ABC-type dipeptide/oligopeptide/nickel transport system permease subunit